MTAALRSAGIGPADVGYISAHGTATIVGYRLETESIKSALGTAAAIPVSSTKAPQGHAVGATGAVEFVIAVRALQSESKPPTAHLERRDPELELGCVPEGARHGMKRSAVLSDSFAFGGTNAVPVACRADRGSRTHRE